MTRGSLAAIGTQARNSLAGSQSATTTLTRCPGAISPPA